MCLQESFEKKKKSVSPEICFLVCCHEQDISVEDEIVVRLTCEFAISCFHVHFETINHL